LLHPIYAIHKRKATESTELKASLEWEMACTAKILQAQHKHRFRKIKTALYVLSRQKMKAKRRLKTQSNSWYWCAKSVYNSYANKMAL